MSGSHPGRRLLVAVYFVVLIMATFLAYAGHGWIGASQRGWQTHAAAGALVVGWVALVGGGMFAQKFLKHRRRSNLVLATSCSLIVVGAYAIFLAWGGRMLI